MYYVVLHIAAVRILFACFERRPLGRFDESNRASSIDKVIINSWPVRKYR